MDSDELTEWAAYAQLDPFGGIRGDYHAAIITANIMNAHAGKTAFHVKDFMPKFGPALPSVKMTGREIHDALMARFGRKPHV